MGKIKNILVPIDFTSTSENALHYAVKFIGEDASIKITAVHIVPESPDDTQRMALFEKFDLWKKKYQSYQKPEMDFLVKTGTVHETILDLKPQLGADMVIIGTQGSAARQVPITITGQLVEDANFPILAIPEKTDTFAINRIALALGKGEIDDTFALGILHDVARKFGAEVHVLTIDNSDAPVEQASNHESVLEYYLETLDYRHVFPKNSDIEKGITAYVEEKDIDLIAILPMTNAKKTSPSEGKLTKILTLRAQVPILAID